MRAAYQNPRSRHAAPVEAMAHFTVYRFPEKGAYLKSNPMWCAYFLPGNHILTRVKLLGRRGPSPSSSSTFLLSLPPFFFFFKPPISAKFITAQGKGRKPFIPLLPLLPSVHSIQVLSPHFKPREIITWCIIHSHCVRLRIRLQFLHRFNCSSPGPGKSYCIGVWFDRD